MCNASSIFSVYTCSNQECSFRNLSECCHLVTYFCPHALSSGRGACTHSIKYHTALCFLCVTNGKIGSHKKYTAMSYFIECDNGKVTRWQHSLNVRKEHTASEIEHVPTSLRALLLTLLPLLFCFFSRYTQQSARYSFLLLYGNVRKKVWTTHKRAAPTMLWVTRKTKGVYTKYIDEDWMCIKIINMELQCPWLKNVQT